MSLDSFYYKILNIGDADKTDIISKIVLEEKEELYKKVNELDGFCKYLACRIKNRLDNLNIKTIIVDLNNVNSVDHVILINYFKDNEKIRYFIIDPSYTQFCYNKNKILCDKYREWSNNILVKTDKELVKNLVENGCGFINKESFQNYINSFINKNVEIDIEKYIKEKQTHIK